VVVEVARRMGKTPLEVQDYPGFISNRLLMPMINEAIEALREGVATKEAIDGIMRLGMNHPMGPLELADFIGLDTCLAIMEVLHRGFGDDKYRPSPLLRRMVQAGLLGRKAGRGFYTYDEKGNKVG
jgi:3-hydroxybutyryl-CoA dehydrogenase